MDRKANVLVIGSGPAGYTAAIYASRAGLDTLLLTGDQVGGQLLMTTDVENYPGFAKAVQGPWLMSEMEQQAKNVGTEVIFDQITAIKKADYPFVSVGASGASYASESVIIATGAQAKWLGLESEKKFKGYGVSGCATCDGFFFKNKQVVVIGGGNTAAEEALYLTNHASKVYLVHRRDALRAEKILQDRLLRNEKIEIIWNHRLQEVLGSDDPKSVTGCVLQSTTGGDSRALDIDGIFIAIGHSPCTAVFKGVVDMDGDGYIATAPDSVVTSVDGIFAAGDVRDKIYRQAVTAAGDGCKAALDAAKFIERIRDS